MQNADRSSSAVNVEAITELIRDCVADIWVCVMAEVKIDSGDRMSLRVVVLELVQSSPNA